MLGKFFTMKLSGTTDDIPHVIRDFKITCPHVMHDQHERTKRAGKKEIELYFSPVNTYLDVEGVEEILEFVAKGTSVKCLSCTMTIGTR